MPNSPWIRSSCPLCNPNSMPIMNAKKTKWMSFAIACLIGGIASTLARSIEESSSFLTADSKKAWIVNGKLEIYLGQTEKCKDGWQIIFQSDNSGTEKKCENGTLNNRRFDWNVYDSEEGERKIKLTFQDGETADYRLVLRDLSIKHETILRTIVGDSKVDETRDLTLTYVIDD